MDGVCHIPVALGTQAAAEAFNDLLLILLLVAAPASFEAAVVDD